jgi:hypothetical protein
MAIGVVVDDELEQGGYMVVVTTSRAERSKSRMVDTPI